MGLLITLHLQPVLNITEKRAGCGQRGCIFPGKKLVSHQLLQRAQGLRFLQDWQTSGLEQLQALGDELDLANPPASELHVPVYFSRFEHLILDADFH